MPDQRTPLSTILTLVDAVPDPRLDHESVRGWPDGTVARMEGEGLLVALDPFGVAHCDECLGRHDVVYIEDHRGETLVWVVCPEVGSYDVDPATLRNWRIDVDRLGRLVAHGLNLKGTPEELVDGRLWRLGRVYESETWCEVHFGRALHHSDAGSILERLPERAICLVPRQLPDSVKGDRVFLPIGEIATWEGNRLVLDHVAFVSVDVPARRRPKRRRASRLAAIEAIEREMRQHLKAARDHAYDTELRTGIPQLLPSPKQYELAQRCGISPATVCNCIKESEELRRLRDLADDLYGLMAHPDDFVSSISPVGVW